jgi:hypothetical protein
MEISKILSPDLYTAQNNVLNVDIPNIVTSQREINRLIIRRGKTEVNTLFMQIGLLKGFIDSGLLPNMQTIEERLTLDMRTIREGAPPFAARKKPILTIAMSLHSLGTGLGTLLAPPAPADAYAGTGTGTGAGAGAGAGARR